MSTQTKPAWTPGPWKTLGYHGPYERTISTVEKPHREIASAHADSWDGGYRLDRMEANAHLIASAPDLYDALQAICDAQGYCGADDMAALMRTAQRALAKARGEQPATNNVMATEGGAS
jgi:hypothetical protein